MRDAQPKAAFESRIRTVLLAVLLASLLLQAGTAILLEQTGKALEAELQGPLSADLTEMAETEPAATHTYGGLWQRRRGLETWQQFYLRDTLAPAVGALWAEIPPLGRRRLQAGMEARVERENSGSFELRLYRRVGQGPEARILCAGRQLPAYRKFLVLQRWHTGFRTLGFLLVLAAVFLVAHELARPFRRLQRVAADAQSSFRLQESTAHEESEAVIETFRATIAQLKASQKELEARYLTSEGEREHLGRLNLQIIDAIPSGLVAADAEGRIVQFNRSAEHLPGLGMPDVKLQLVDFFAPWPALAAACAESTGGARARREGECEVTQGNVTCYFEYEIVPVAREGVLVLLQDRTVLRRLELLLAQRARLAALGETAAGLAHELRNAMGAIVGYAKLVGRTRGKESCEIAERIADEAGAMEAMLKRFLEVARPAQLQPIELDGAELVQEAAARFADRFSLNNVTLTVDDSGPVPVRIDPFWFRQALVNLLENALAHVPSGGNVSLSWESTPDSWCVSVADSGPGIEPEWREKVFAPFVSLRPGGTGLGLALVGKVMTAHDGRVEVTDSSLGGARFLLTFPRTERSSKEDAGAPGQPAAAC